MREVRDVRHTFAELNGRLGTRHDREYFAFVLRRCGVKDVQIETDAIVAPSYVPIEMMLKEGILALESDGVVPTPCARCAKYHDPDRDDGIFRNPGGLEGFVCRSCAEQLSAWSYFQEWYRG